MATLSPKERAELMKELTSRVQNAIKDIHNVVIVMSGKGGVGKSITSASLALALSRLGFKVSILDADVHGPSIPWLLGVENERMLADEEGRILPVNAGGVGVVSVELAMDKKELPLIWRGPLKTRAILDLLSMVRWENLDYLVVDLPPGTGDEAQTVARYLSSKNPLGILVMTPGRMVSHIVVKAKNFAKIVGLNLLGVVVNMSYFRCPYCGKTTKIFGEFKDVGIEILAELPLDPEISRAADEGRLQEVFMENGHSEWVSSIMKVAKKLVNAVGQP
jgi:ATP-binding protein involved in chromosome partitioning